MKPGFPSRPLHAEILLFMLYDLEETAMAICSYRIYNPVCIRLFFIAVIEYTEKKTKNTNRQLWRERVRFCLRDVPTTVGKAWHRSGKYAPETDREQDTKPQSPPPVTYFLQQGFTFQTFHNLPPGARNKYSKMSLPEIFHKQTVVIVITHVRAVTVEEDGDDLVTFCHHSHVGSGVWQKILSLNLEFLPCLNHHSVPR